MAAIARTILTPTDITLGRIERTMNDMLRAGTAIASLSGSVESAHDRHQAHIISGAIDGALNQLPIITMVDLAKFL